MDLQKNLNHLHIPKEAEIICVVKYASLEQIKELLEKDVENLGFNTLQQFKEIKEKLNLEKVKTHFIGNIQSNKIKKILDLQPYLIQSVDCLDLAKKINDYCASKNMMQKILLQIKTDETKKNGISIENFTENFNKIKQLKNLDIMGIMSLPPELNSIGEKKLREIYKSLLQIKKEFNLKILSCGTSNDYKIALQEGSNMLRLGRILFS